jgi:3-deoxy-D-manno-octulosonic-acid transferase
MALVYDFLFLIFAVVSVPLLALKGKLRRELFQRTGAVPAEVRERCAGARSVWVHAVSVGEVQAVLGLIDRLRAQLPRRPVVLTTVTPTGYRLARSRLSGKADVLYAPLDFSGVVRRYIRGLNPGLYITAETEIWPNLWSALAARRVPIAVFNGRISGKSFRRYRLVGFFLRRLFQGVGCFCMQSGDDARRVEALGADPARVRVTGNVKFDGAVDLSGYERAAFGYGPDDLLLVAGSTHPGEEEILLRLYARLRPEFPRLRLLLAPRHVERYAAVAALVQRHGLQPVAFSQKGPEPSGAETVVVVDTIGHLQKLYALGTVIFVGKSLTGRGGQNIIEPAACGKPVVTGPHMQNFQGVMAVFLRRQAVLQVSTPAALGQALRRLLADKTAREDLGGKARATVLSQQGATTAAFEIISPLFNYQI